MTGELTIFRQGGQVSTAFQGVHLPTQRLDDGVAAGFAKCSYKGSKWGIKYQGRYDPVQARMPDGTIIQSPFLDCVILKAAGHPSKAWYEGLYQEGDSAPPDCWSTNGLKPDIGVPKQQSATCIGCANNVWGSKVNRDTGEATRGKACMDSMRLAVVPVGDIENKFYGGPMMLNVPPTSLKRLGPYQNALMANGFHYAQVWTRITFEAQSAYPLFVFDAMSALNDVQAAQVIKMLQHPLIDRILNAELRTAEAWDDPSLRDTAEKVAQTNYAPGVNPQPAQSSTMAAGPATQPQATQPRQDDLAIPPHLVRAPQPTVSAPPPSAPAPGIVQETPPPHVAPPMTEADRQMGQPHHGHPPEAAPAPAAPSLPPGMQLPPGMTPEMAADFLAQFQPQQEAPKGRGRGGRGRTPPVQPTNMDSSQATGAPAPTPAAAQQAIPMPGPTMVVPGQPQTNGAAQPDQAVGAIMSTVKSLL